MYGHGFAALFLGEIYGMTPGGGDTAQSARVHEALVKRLPTDREHAERRGRVALQPRAATTPTSP
jgi:hypothetical protein